MIQNRAGSSAAQTAANGGVAYRVSGKIDRNYNHNYRQYLKKRCKLPYYDLKGGSTSFVFEPRFGTSVHVGSKRCCTDDCRDFHTGISPNGTPNQPATYKRNNWTFRRQGAVDNDIYIMKKTYQGLNTCSCPPDGDPPVQRRDPPQYPQNNPKNYNKRGTRD